MSIADVIQPMGAVVLVLLLLGAALMAFRKRGAVTFRRETRRLEVLERIALGPQHAVHLVRLGDRSLLISTSPSSCQVLESESLALARRKESE